MTMHTASLRMLLPVAGLIVAGCDPVVNIAGTNFPAWLLCAIAGAILIAPMRPAFAATRLEPHLGPLILIFPCLAIVLACLVYLIFSIASEALQWTSLNLLHSQVRLKTSRRLNEGLAGRGSFIARLAVLLYRCAIQPCERLVVLLAR